MVRPKMSYYKSFAYDDFQDSARFATQMLPDISDCGSSVDFNNSRAGESLKKCHHICYCITHYFKTSSGCLLDKDQFRKV